MVLQAFILACTGLAWLVRASPLGKCSVLPPPSEPLRLIKSRPVDVRLQPRQSIHTGHRTYSFGWLLHPGRDELCIFLCVDGVYGPHFFVRCICRDILVRIFSP